MPVTVTIKMGAKGPLADPSTAKVSSGDSVNWIAADDNRWWVVLMKDGKTPFPNSRKTFKGKGKGVGKAMKTAPGLKKGSQYDYWLIYQDAEGQPQVVDPKIVIED